MPTLPNEPRRLADLDPGRLRAIAESFGSEAERYDRSRPSYPEAMVEAIVSASPGHDVLEVGIGTGIAARQFRAAGCRVLGVDPDERMAEVARESGFVVEIARFEDWETKGRTFDAVIAGQTWHWVDAVAGAAKAATALRPGGRLGLFWNVFQFPADLGAAFAGVYRQVLPDSPLFTGISGGLAAYSALLSKARTGILQVGAFGEAEQWQFDWEREYRRDEWLEGVPTSGGHNQFPPGKLEALLAGLGAAIDEAGGSFTTHYAAVVLTAVRTEPA